MFNTGSLTKSCLSKKSDPTLCSSHFLESEVRIPKFGVFKWQNCTLGLCFFSGLLVKCGHFGVDTLLKTHCLPCCWIHPQSHPSPHSPTDACEISCSVTNGRNTGESGKEKGFKDWIQPQGLGLTYIVCHTCTHSADHLSEWIGSACVQDIELHHTKCTALINHPTAACMFKELRRDIGEAQYCFVIDKSKQSCVYLFGTDSPASEKSLQLLKSACHSM